MKRNRATWTIGLAALPALFLLVLIWDRTHTETHTSTDVPTPGSISESAKATPATQTESRKKPVAIVSGVFSAPIEFYGRVVDQNRQPVSGAEVGFQAADQFMAAGTRYSAKSDSDGYFSITGIRGAGLGVIVTKDGYDKLKGHSNQTFGYGMGPDSFRKVPPTKGKPAMFVLRKKAACERLVRISSRQYPISRDGTPNEVNLETGKAVDAGEGHLRVECWANDEVKDAQRRFDWKCRISVPGGGLVGRNPEFDFEAPEDGYRLAEEITVRTDDPRQRWSPEEDREYFLKLGGGKYARVQLSVHVGSNPMVILESYLNPSGSRNLEYDPKKKISVH